MLGSDQVIVAVATLLGVQLLALAVTARLRRSPGDGDPTAYVDGDSVECRSCGAENDLGYRFCRNCVETLPAGRAFRRGSGSPTFPGAF